MTRDTSDAVDPDRAERIYYAIEAGTVKDACEWDLTEAESALWDVVARQVQEGNQRGVIWASTASLDRDEAPSTETQDRGTSPDMEPQTSYAFNRELKPGQLLAYLGPPEGQRGSLCVYFDHYGPMDTGGPPSEWDDTTWYEHGYTRYWDSSTDEVRTSDIRIVGALMSQGNGYWTIAVD